MATEILNSLISLLHRGDLIPLLGGGWAVAHHGYPRFTQDFDFIFSKDEKEVVKSVMAEMKCRISFDLPVATRFEHPNLSVPAIDALWIEPASYRRLLDNSVNDPNDERLKIISLADLLAMKLHALQAKEERGDQDERDIKYLLAANPGTISLEDFRSLVDKHAPQDLHSKVLSYHPQSS